MPRKVNIRIGGGFTGIDTSINQLAWNLPSLLPSNWNGKLDVVYKFYGLDRDFDGKWTKAHAVGLFLNGGKQSQENLKRFLPAKNHESINPDFNQNLFFEAETGVMLREELRISGGIGVAQWGFKNEDENKVIQQTYASFTTGLSPRLFSFLELDILASALLIQNEIKPRATINAVFLLKTWKR